MARKKKKHGEHHGGAWKVAYADFVTAMMALFMVLWICSQDEEIVKATSRYFQNPFDAPDQQGPSLFDFQAGSPAQSSLENSPPNGQSRVNMEMLQEISDEFYKLMNINQEEAQKPVEIEVTQEGLRITLYDRPGKPLFKRHTSEFTTWGNYAVQNLSWLMDRYELRVRIDAYTPAGYPTISENYGVWELTADRANATRRLLEHFALDPAKVSQISGYGDRHGLPGIEPEDPSNQRIELSLEVQEADKVSF
ncbi:MAG: flagellar motor protein MotB [Opitutales bacterium]